MEPLQAGDSKPSAGLAAQVIPQKCASKAICCTAPDCTTAKDGNPHFKIVRLLDKDMILGRKKPQEIATPNLIPALPKKVCAVTACDQIEFELCMGMAPVCGGLAVVTPDVPVELRGKMQPLNRHDKK